MNFTLATKPIEERKYTKAIVKHKLITTNDIEDPTITYTKEIWLANIGTNILLIDNESLTTFTNNEAYYYDFITKRFITVLSSTIRLLIAPFHVPIKPGFTINGDIKGNVFYFKSVVSKK